MNERHTSNEHEARNADKKRVWEAPIIEELDFSATEASYGIPGTHDFGIYTN